MAKEYFKNLGNAVNNVAKSLFGFSPNLSVGLSMFNERVFRWDISGYTAYNNKIFFTGANIIVRKMIEAPITFNEKKKQATKSIDKFYSKNISNPERNTVKSAAVVELPDHPLASMFTIDIMEDFWNYYNFGDGFLWFESLDGELSRNKKPVAVHSLNPERVYIVTNNARFDNVERYDYTADNGEVIPIPKNQILRLKHWNPRITADMKGFGLQVACAKDIALNEAGNEAEGAAYVNGGRGTLFSSKTEVTTDGKVVDKMTGPQMSALKETITKDLSGARNNRKQKFTNGEVVVTPYGDTLAEMEINKSEDSRWKNIFAIMGIPKELSPVNFTGSENSVQAGYKALVTNLVISQLRKFDQKLTALIQQWFPGIIAIHDLTEYAELAPDLKLMKEVYGTPSISENERRKVFGFDELPGDIGKAILVSSGLMNLSDIVNNEFDQTPDAETL